VLGLALAATFAYGILHPAVQHRLMGFMLGSQPSGGPEFPWSSLRLAAELRLEIVSEGAADSGRWIPGLLVLDAWAPLWIFGLAVLNGASGYLNGRVGGTVPLPLRTWVLVLTSAGGFLGGLDLAVKVTRTSAAPLLVALLIPLAVPAAVLVTLAATRARVVDERDGTA